MIGRTRDRVLRLTLDLMNARGPDRVTTAEIAAAAGINEGNLYYYFQRKEQLIEALFDRFAQAMLEVAERQVSNPADPACYAAYQRGWFSLMWDYRFFYRDGLAVRALAPRVRDRLAAMTAHGQAAVRRVFLQMRAHGVLAASDLQIERVIANIWIVSSYWMDFRGASAAQPEDLDWGYRQVEALYAPYLTHAVAE
jgi:AcrR family transcriptional regulator